MLIAGVVAVSDHTAADLVASDPALHDLIRSFAAHDPDELLDQIVEAAARLNAVPYAGMAEVDPAHGSVRLVRVREPAGDPLRIRQLLGDVLRRVGPAAEPVRLTVGSTAFLCAPIPLVTRGEAVIWVAGRPFDDRDEHLLVRFATAVGRGLEGARGFEAALRMLRAVHAFRGPQT
jgi:hypothetical protein